MRRLVTAVLTDIRVQYRNYLYHVGIVISLIIAIALAVLAAPHQLVNVVPAAILLIIGGTTMLYVAGMIIFEKDEGTLFATIVSPLTTSQYIGAKLISLLILASFESLLSVYGAIAIHYFTGAAFWPHILWLIAGILAIGAMYTLIGIAMVVRFKRITDFLIPMAGFAVIMQIPFLYFWGLVPHPALLLIPTSAPTMLMAGAFRPLAAWEQIYALGYTLLSLGAFALWAIRAFKVHIIERAG